MSEKIEELKKQIDDAGRDGDWKTPYTKLMREVYAQDVLFFALSKSEYDPEVKTSTPLISTKDFGGAPALYVFSDVSIASVWMSHYRHVTDDMKYGLIGAIKKDDHGFLSVFQIARKLGAQMMMLDEGGSFVGIALDAFLDANGIDASSIEIPLDEDGLNKLLGGGEAPEIRFAPVPAIPLKAD